MNGIINEIRYRILFDIESILENQHDIETGKLVDFEGEWADLYYSGFQFNYKQFNEGFDGVKISEESASIILEKFNKDELLLFLERLGASLDREIDIYKCKVDSVYLVDIFYLTLAEDLIDNIRRSSINSKYIDKMSIPSINRQIEKLKNSLKQKAISSW